MRLLILFLFSLQCTLFAQEPHILGIGAAAVDLLIQVEDQFIEKQAAVQKGTSNASTPDKMDQVILRSGKIPKIVSGGSAANTIRALAQLNEPCAFLSHLGDDELGAIFRASLNELQIEPKLLRAAFTSRVLCCISPDGQRTFLATDSILNHFSPEPSDLKNAKWLHVEARHLDNSDYLEKTIQLACELNIPISMDLSGADVVQRHKERLFDLITRYVTILFCNEAEVIELMQLDAEQGCLLLQTLCPVSVVTLGEKGCLIGSNNELLKIPAYEAHPIDTTGAGDYFTAGFLYGYLHQLPLAACGQIGNHLGSAVIEVIGASLSAERWTLIRDKITKLKEAFDGSSSPK